MINEESFSTLYKRKRVTLCTLRNPNGMRVQVTNYGAKIVSLWAPDKDGQLADVVLGFSTLDEWIQKETYFNAVIGRVANRIKDGRFELDGQSYQLAVNNGTNSLHGGVVGFNERVWEIVAQTPYSVSMHLRAADGEESFPGTLDVYVHYVLQRDNTLRISYEAKTDKPTLCALTQHAYFNLKGEGNGDVLDHTLQVLADHYTPLDASACPTGEVVPVEGTPMDFREPVRISERILDPFFTPGRGIDNNWCLKTKEEADEEREQAEKPLRLAARVSAAGRTMEVLTTMPGMQVYTGNFVEQNVGKSGKIYDVQTAICLEAQNWPDAVNHANFPIMVLRPGEVYFEEVAYKFV